MPRFEIPNLAIKLISITDAQDLYLQIQTRVTKLWYVKFLIDGKENRIILTESYVWKIYHMNTMSNKLHNKLYINISFSDEYMYIQVKGKKQLDIPLKNFPRLERATNEQRNNFTFSYRGIFLDSLNEDINIDALYAGFVKDYSVR
ncbi:DUF2442 domain-containing protein [Yersinia rochesterensis]|uniref:DUF2442 domain-containing protein n=1 Tax=Yersinia rochesterensis TaxID=1604335 RepID=UPI002853723D|nr:DUF2442 domain-containing protein [Yersinia rochesterensis]MDR5020052.1 DUF2442 domain-containing protein [Yersinia rochesterensis]